MKNHTQKIGNSYLNRRSLLSRAGMGIGALALLDLNRRCLGSDNPLAPSEMHHPAKAKAVISLFMHGGPSQVDTFDPKPLLQQYAGKTLPPGFADLNLEFTKASEAKLLASHRSFRRCGESGIEMSDLFEHLPKVADELAVIRSCYHTEFNHAPALYLTHTGSSQMGRPSLGAWTTYGLGSESEELPGYIVMRDGPLKGGPVTYGNGFLPAVHSATELRNVGTPILYLNPPDTLRDSEQRRVLDFSQSLNRRFQQSYKHDNALEARIAAYELAYRMQTTAPEAVDLSQETEQTKSLYGLDQDETRSFGTQCLNARRLVERGVRFVQLYHGGGGDGWGHGTTWAGKARGGNDGGGRGGWGNTSGVDNTNAGKYANWVRVCGVWVWVWVWHGRGYGSGSGHGSGHGRWWWR